MNDDIEQQRSAAQLDMIGLLLRVAEWSDQSGTTLHQCSFFFRDLLRAAAEHYPVAERELDGSCVDNTTIAAALSLVDSFCAPTAIAERGVIRPRGRQ